VDASDLRNAVDTLLIAGQLVAPSTADAAAATERLAAWVIGALTAIVIGGVTLIIYVPHGGHADGSSWLPAINASLNGTAAVLLGTGYVLIRRHRIAAHRACMIAAFAASSLFLITYLVHHARVGSVPFHGAAWLRPVYLGLLVPAHRAGGVRGAAGSRSSGVRRGGDPRVPAPSTSALRPGRQPKSCSGCSSPAGCT
jgi:uncharacterized membrane protein YozB (DUF420 family)